MIVCYRPVMKTNVMISRNYEQLHIICMIEYFMKSQNILLPFLSMELKLSDRIGSNVWNRKNLTPLGWGDFGIEVDIWKRRHSGRGIFWKGAGWDRMEDLARILKGRTLGWKILKAGILEGRILGGEHFAGVGHSGKG